MISYNMDFLIAALIFLCFIWYHFQNQKKLDNARNRVFEFFIGIGILDIVFDMVSTILMVRTDLTTVAAAKIALTILYLVQMGLLAAFFCYVQTFREITEQKMRRIMVIGAVPCVLYCIVIISNIWTEMFFGFTEYGVYRQGPYYLWTYFYALCYMLVIVVYCIVYKKEMGKKRLTILLEFVVILFINVALQAILKGTLMIGFGIALGITVMYMTTSNPYGYMDNLTGAFDKNSLGYWIQDKIDRNDQMSILSIDVYKLKQVNKIYGDHFGDQLLIQSSQKLQNISGNGYVFRISGNRFLIIFDTLVSYERAKNEIVKLFRNDFFVDTERISFPAVICGITEAQALKKSDIVLSYIEYLVSLAQTSEETVLLQSDEKTLNGFHYAQEVERFLNDAIEEDLFDVYYQPVYSCDTEKVVTLEALSRLKHPELGPIAPDVFINIAEKNGHIVQIGLLQFERVCRFVKEHEDIMQTVKNIKFNLSPMEILKEGNAGRLVKIINKYDLKPAYFNFEITETVASDYSEAMYSAIEVFTSAGIGLCLDDFGSGYANLNTVLKLPFEVIKLDRSLLSGICNDSQIATFYHSIVTTLQNLGYNIVSEGVETEEEVRLLHSWGVNMIQGFYYSRPLQEQELLKKLSENNK